MNPLEMNTAVVACTNKDNSLLLSHLDNQPEIYTAQFFTNYYKTFM